MGYKHRNPLQQNSNKLRKRNKRNNQMDENMTHKTEYEEMINEGIIPCFEINTAVIYFEPTDKGFAVGTSCNVGLLKDFEYIYDNDFSFDENLNGLHEQIIDYYEEAEV